MYDMQSDLASVTRIRTYVAEGPTRDQAAQHAHRKNPAHSCRRPEGRPTQTWDTTRMLKHKWTQNKLLVLPELPSMVMSAAGQSVEPTYLHTVSQLGLLAAAPRQVLALPTCVKVSQC